MYQKTAQGWIKHLDFIMIDIACLYISYISAYMIRHGVENPYFVTVYGSMSMVLVLSALAVAVIFEIFHGVMRRGIYVEFVSTSKQVFLVMLLAICYLFLEQQSNDYSRMIMVLTGVLYFITSFIARCAWKCYLKKKVLIGVKMRSLLVITTKDLASRMIKNFENSNCGGFHIAGIVIVDTDMNGEKILEIPVVATKETAPEYVCREWVDEVLINIPSTDIQSEELIQKFYEMGVTVHLRLIHKEDNGAKQQFIETIGCYKVLTTTIRMVKWREVAIKRLMDICCGLVGCVITLLLVVVLGPVIYIKSPGPIFFAQTRVGKNGHKFKIYKFRSMYLDAEERKKEFLDKNRIKDGRMFKVDWDTRIIGSEKGPNKGVGNFIRKYSLDEWPQFLNVLKGDMSLIGTRPPTVDEWETYELHHRVRLAVKPGLTGMWQVSGRSSITDFEEVVKLDTQYITNWNLGLDMKILFKTVSAVLRHDGAM